jgi:hypothetical protein
MDRAKLTAASRRWMLRKICTLFLVSLAALTQANALQLGLRPYLQFGSGHASGSYVSAVEQRYAELGASSIVDLGSASAYYGFALGGLGLDLSLSKGAFFLWKEPFSFAVGLDAGAWGAAVSGKTASGIAFASTQAWSLAASIHLLERFRIAIGPKDSLSLSLGPLAGLNFRYLVKEYISGIGSDASLAPVLADLGFAGISLGIDYSRPLGPNRLTLGLHGDIGITPLAARGGALGGEMSLPWRLLASAGIEFPLSGRGGMK